MEQTFSLFKSQLPQLVKSCADWFQVDVTIKLFGVKVFSFTWPPKSENVESKS